MKKAISNPYPTQSFGKQNIYKFINMQEKSEKIQTGTSLFETLIYLEVMLCTLFFTQMKRSRWLNKKFEHASINVDNKIVKRRKLGAGNEGCGGFVPDYWLPGVRL